MQVNDENLASAAPHMRLLAGQDFFKPEKSLLDLLTKTLVKHADDVDHIERMIATWVERTRQMLHPADIPGLAHETSEHAKLPVGCQVCKGENFIATESGMGRCLCERGQQLAAMDKQREAALPPIIFNG